MALLLLSPIEFIRLVILYQEVHVSEKLSVIKMIGRLVGQSSTMWWDVFVKRPRQLARHIFPGWSSAPESFLHASWQLGKNHPMCPHRTIIAPPERDNEMSIALLGTEPNYQVSILSVSKDPPLPLGRNREPCYLNFQYVQSNLCLLVFVRLLRRHHLS